MKDRRDADDAIRGLDGYAVRSLLSFRYELPLSLQGVPSPVLLYLEVPPYLDGSALFVVQAYALQARVWIQATTSSRRVGKGIQLSHFSCPYPSTSVAVFLHLVAT